MADQGSIASLKAAIQAVLNNSVPDESIEPDDHNDLLVNLLDTIGGLSKVIREDGTTGGYNITISNGDLIELASGSFTGSIDRAVLTANRTWTFPDADGVIAFLSDIPAVISNHSGLTLDDGTNPHGTTKSDVGLSNVPNVDATLRSNHTGTQTASTISDFDTEVSNNPDVVANTAKVTNATHTGEVTGSTALTVNPTAISNKTALGSLAGTEEFLINDGGTLKKVLASNVGGADGNGIYDGSGSLSGATTVTMGGNDLILDGGLLGLGSSLGLKLDLHSTGYGFGIQANLLESIAGTGGTHAWGVGTSGSLTQRMFLNNTGLKIGTGTPTAKLEVDGTALITGLLGLGSGLGLKLDLHSTGYGFGIQASLLESIAGTSGSHVWGVGTSGSLTQRMFLDNTGLMIGTGTPTAKLHVGGDTQIDGTINGLNIETVSGDQYLSHSSQSATGNEHGLNLRAAQTRLNVKTGGFIALDINNVPKLFIESTGNIGIGNSITTPTALLQVAGTFHADGALKFANGAVNGYSLVSDASGNATWQDRQAKGVSNTVQTTNGSGGFVDGGLILETISGDQYLSNEANSATGNEHGLNLRATQTRLNVKTGGFIALDINNVPQVFINSSGNVGIGNNFLLPTSTLHVAGDTQIDGNTDLNGDVVIGSLAQDSFARLTVDATDGVAAMFKDSTNNLFQVASQGAGRGRLNVYNGGSVGINLDAGGVSYFNTGGNLVVNSNSATANDGALAVHTDTSNVGLKIFDQNGDTSYRFVAQNNLNKFEIYNFGGLTLQHRFQSNGNDSYVNGTTSANFGVGTSSPNATLHVVGSTLLDGNLGVFGTTPIAQPTTAIVAPAPVAVGGVNVQTNDTFEGYTLSQVVKALRNLGILA